MFRPRWTLVSALLLFVISCDEVTPLETAKPILMIDDAAIDFGPIPEGTTASKSLSITNAAQVPLAIELSFAAGGSSDFSVAMASRDLAATSVATISVDFTPRGPGSDEAILVVTSDDPRKPRTEIRVTGGPIGPSLTVSPDPVDFGPASTAIVSRPIALRSSGTSNLHISEVLIDPTGNTDFVLRAGTAALELAPGAEAEVIVDYTRTGLATAGRLLVRSDDPASMERATRLLPDPLRACQDGADNDGDRLADFPDDPGCTSATDDDESNPPECDDGTTMMCGSTTGVCRLGTRACANRLWGPCEGGVEPSPETCDGTDEDCDARTDEEITETCAIHGCTGVRACVESSSVAGGLWTDCIAVAVPPEQCDGADNDCDGMIDDGIVETCVDNGCTGTRICVPGGTGQFTSCQVMRQTEICNNADDDCDGTPDNGIADLSCGTGSCLNTVAACIGGAPNTCTPGAPNVESCNSLDDNCDGVPDNLPDLTCGTGGCRRTVSACAGGAPNVCTPGNPAAETCNNADDNCDGTADNLPNLTCGTGGCFRSVAACIGGLPNTCLPGNPTTETCNNADDNCDGTADNLPNISCGTGACFRSVAACVGGAPNTCTPGAPMTETCNNADDNCDGTADNLPNISCGTGACRRTVAACAGGAPNTCIAGNPVTETCNNADDDCNGVTDDLPNLTCGTGACFRSVAACVGGAPNTCTAGAPVTETCNNADDNCDGTADNLPNLTCGTGACFRSVAACVGGAPNTCTPGMPGTEICNMADDDCDGTPDDGNVCGGTTCGLMSTGPDPHEVNNTNATSRPSYNWSANGTFIYNFDITLPSGDIDWSQYNFPGVGQATFAEMTAEVTCVSWAGAGCGATPPTVRLEAWYFDDCFPQQDDFDTGQMGLAVVTSAGPVSSLGFCGTQRFRVRASPSNTVCAGEAVNAHLRVTVTWTP